MKESARTVLDAAKLPDARRAAHEFVAQASRDAAFQLEACVHCGQCADACHFHLVTRRSAPYAGLQAAPDAQGVPARSGARSPR